MVRTVQSLLLKISLLSSFKSMIFVFYPFSHFFPSVLVDDFIDFIYFIILFFLFIVILFCFFRVMHAVHGSYELCVCCELFLILIIYRNVRNVGARTVRRFGCSWKVREGKRREEKGREENRG